MGCDLILGVLEIEKGKEPDWEAAGKLLADLTYEHCAGIIEEVMTETPEEGTPEQDEVMEEFRGRMDAALDELQAMWKGHHRCAVRWTLSQSEVLAFGGGSWGEDPFEGYTDVCAVADLAWKAAGGKFQE